MNQKPELKTALGAARKVLLAAALFSLFINVLMLATPFYMLQIYDRVLGSQSESTLIALTALAAFLILVLGALDFIRSRLLVRMSADVDARLSGRVFEATFHSVWSGRDGPRAQALRDMDGLRQFLAGSGPVAFFDAPWVPIYLIVITLLHPLLGLIATAGAVLLFIVAMVNEWMTRGALREANTEAVRAAQSCESGLRNAEVVGAMGMLGRLRERWMHEHGNVLAQQSVASDRAGLFTTMSKTARIALQISILGTGGYLAITHEISAGAIFAASLIMARALAPVEQAIGNWQSFVNARSSYARLSRLLNENPTNVSPLPLPTPKGALSLEDVTAGPPAVDLTVLNKINLELAPGEVLGVIGPSASGKSALARVIVGMWQPQSGAVRLDGAELNQWDRESLGRYIGYLPQDIELFRGTVAENIARLDPSADPEAIIQAARRAGVHDMVLRLPEGYETEIGPDGVYISAGQRQRIALARAIFGRPALVVLDEPNSNLDVVGELALNQTIGTLKREGTTVVVIAHRPSAIDQADRIMVLKQGEVQSLGPKNEILAASAGGKTPARREVARVTPLKQVS